MMEKAGVIPVPPQIINMTLNIFAAEFILGLFILTSIPYNEVTHPSISKFTNLLLHIPLTMQRAFFKNWCK